MASSVRIYESDKAAQDAAARLAEAGFADQAVLLAGSDASAVNAAVRQGLVPSMHKDACVRSLQHGKALVGVKYLFGRGLEAIGIMESSGGVDSGALSSSAYIAPRDPGPLSNALRIPLLAQFVPGRSSFGFPVLSRRAAPLSSMLMMPTLTRGGRQKSTFGFPLLTRSGGPTFDVALLTSQVR